MRSPIPTALRFAPSVGRPVARLAPALALTAVAGLVGCDDDATVVSVPAGIQIDPPSVDFGNVQVGTQKPLEVFVRNTGGTVLEIDPRRGNPWDDDVFNFDLVGERGGQIPAGGVGVISLSFAPTQLGEISAVLTLRTNVPDQETVDVEIRGNGVTTTLAVDPRRVDFENVVVGTTKTEPVALTNNSDVSSEIEFLRGDNVRLCSGQTDSSTYCVRFRDRAIDQNREFTLNAGETAQLEVQFAPTTAGLRSEGYFTLKACDLPVCEVRVDLTGLGVEAGLRCRPPSLDFGQVNPGSTSRQSVTCENIANEQVTLVSWALTPDSSPAFEVETARPQVLNEGDTVSIETLYAPTSLGDATGTLRLETDNQNSPNIDVALEGTGGGPDIQVLPPQLNFGRVSLIAPSRRNLVITNTGFAPLQINQIEVDTENTQSFSSPDANATVIQPGDSETVTIEFTPREEGEIVSAVRINSNDGDEEDLEVVVRGEGVNLPPCNFAVVPAALNFGAVQRTRTLRRSFEIRNQGSDICLITAVRLVGGTDPSFSLPDGDIISQEIQPGAAETVTVEFAPTAAGTFTGEVEFSISSPTSPFNTVPLTGVGADDTLLIVPNELDFGVIGVPCSSRARLITVYNTGNSTVDINSIQLAQPVNPAFSLPSLPAPLPGGTLSLPAGQSTQFEVGFRADAISSYASAVEVNATVNGAPVTYIVSLDGEGAEDATQVDEFEQLGKPKVDILFVIDPSGSMSQEQAALTSNFQAFIQFAEAQGLDYQIGVTNTAVGTSPAAAAQGRLISANPGTTESSVPSGPAQYRIVTPRTQPSPSAVFQANASLDLFGGSAADESGLRAAELALSPPVVFGHNAGFLRSDAVLSLIFVSDEPDQSNGSVDFYINFFLSIKGFRNTNLFSASFIGAPTPPGRCNGPGGNATADGRYLAVANRTGGIFQSICTSDWSRSLEDLSTTAFGFKSRFFLTNQPVIATLAVFVDGSELPAQSSGGTVNWTYDFATNSVNFAPYSTPEPGAQIRVEYAAECLP